ncbi:hypothetical protein RB195_019212 [Necator americanus]|uniref:Mos1 transposase HTH domain-containing protein n=1 Tax=Necator americanus TaxID=51031 RepID=A0ABR1CD58_NECAM
MQLHKSRAVIFYQWHRGSGTTTAVRNIIHTLERGPSPSGLCTAGSFSSQEEAIFEDSPRPNCVEDSVALGVQRTPAGL